MLRRWMASLVKLLTCPLFGTHVVPRGAVVDAGLFPEDEFPVHCTKCRYLLRGLPDGRCPECGTTFQRGRLLVRQYVLKHDEPSFRSTPAGKWARWLLIGGAVVIVVGSAACWGLLKFVLWRTMLPTAPQAVDWTSSPCVAVLVVWGIVWGIGYLMLTSATILFTRQFHHTRAKRRRVFAALNLPKT